MLKRRKKVNIMKPQEYLATLYGKMKRLGVVLEVEEHSGVGMVLVKLSGTRV